MEGLAVDDEAGDALGVVRDNVGRALLLPEIEDAVPNVTANLRHHHSPCLPLEGLLAEKVALVEVPDELLFLRAVLLLRDLDLKRGAVGADSNAVGHVLCVARLPIEKK